MTPFTMTIAGESIETDEFLEVEDPATAEAFANAPSASQDDVDAAVYGAATAYPSWSSNQDAREQALLGIADILEHNAASLAELITLEQGKPLSASTGEVHAAAGFFRDFATMRLEPELVRESADSYASVMRRPLGVVAVVTPWNAPLYVAAMKLAPALSVGNTAVVKPSPDAPLATLRFGELIRDAIPAGVVNVISGGDSVGPWLTGNRTVRAVSFTGSIGTGKRVAAAAGADLKHIVLELGGNDAAIVRHDVEISDVVEFLFGASFGNAGQVCSGVKRIYAHRSIIDGLIDAFVEKAKSLVVGPGMQATSQMGPLTTRDQLRQVESMVEQARDRGGHIVAGGGRLDHAGHFYQPTVVTALDDDVPLVCEEQFGPALPILSFERDDEVIERANRGMYGLGGSIWTNDFERGIELADRLDTGMSWVNTHKGVDPTLPFGGTKWSGLGVERGKWGMQCFTRIHTTSGARLR